MLIGVVDARLGVVRGGQVTNSDSDASSGHRCFADQHPGLRRASGFAWRIASWFGGCCRGGGWHG